MAKRLIAYARRHHVGVVALCVAVVGVPTAWALARNSVGSPQIKPGAVHASDIDGNAVTGGKVKNGSLSRNDFATNSLPSGPTGPAGPVDLCRPGPVSFGPIQNFGGIQTKTLCTDGPVTVLGRCGQLVTGGPTYVEARLLYMTTVDDAIRIGDGDFDVAESPVVVSPRITDSSPGSLPVTVPFAIAAGADQLVGTVFASAKSTNTGTGDGTCQFNAFGG